MRPCAFFTCYCPTCEKLGSTINFFVVRCFVPIWHVVLIFFFLEKIHAPCDTNLQWRIIKLILGMRKTSREAADPRVIRRRRIVRPNAIASVASEEAFLLIECIKKCAARGVLKRNCKLTWMHLWPRVYSVFNETLPYRPWFYTKKGETLRYMTSSSWLW